MKQMQQGLIHLLTFHIYMFIQITIVHKKCTRYTKVTLTEQSHEASRYNLQHISILTIYHRILSNFLTLEGGHLYTVILMSCVKLDLHFLDIRG